MEKQDSYKLLARFNSLYKEMDDVYHSLARHFGLSDCALWILYTMKETQDPLTQSRLCEILSLSKQTVNSALKNLETTGYIKLEPVTGNHKSKQILLTDTGNRFTERTIDQVMSIERQAFEQFSAEEQAVLFRHLETYVNALEKGTQSILNQPIAGHRNQPIKEVFHENYND